MRETDEMREVFSSKAQPGAIFKSKHNFTSIIIFRIYVKYARITCI